MYIFSLRGSVENITYLITSINYQLANNLIT